MTFLLIKIFNIHLPIILLFGYTNASAFFIKWPWSLYYPQTLPGIQLPATVTTGVGTGLGSLNYGFLRPTIIIQGPSTTAATTAATTTTTTTTTTRPPTTTLSSQLFINALLGSALPVNTLNNSLLLSLANAFSNRPIIGGVARPYPVVGGVTGVAGASSPLLQGGLAGGIGGLGGLAGIQPPVVGGLALPGSAGFAGQLSGGISGISGPGQFVLPNGFPVGGGIASSGILPGFLPPGIIGKSARLGGTIAARSSGSGRVLFASQK